MRPDIETFKKAVVKYRGNLCSVAKAFNKDRSTVALWVKEDEEFKAVVRDARMRLFDDCLVAGEVLALGEAVKDENGKVVGWARLPDAKMIQYFLSKLGKEEGFGDEELKEDTETTNAPMEININVAYNEKKHLELQGKREPNEEE